MTKVMQIINTSSDSFSHDSLNTTNQLESIINSNIDVYDVGGQSTKPNFKLISAKEEWLLVKDYIKYLTQKELIVSIDSFKISVISNALKAGCKIINSVAHFTYKEKLQILKLLKKYNAKIVIMHPYSAQNLTQIKRFLIKEANFYIKNGIKSENIILDPGYGFNKSYDLGIQILNNMNYFKFLNCQTLIGISRKGSIQKRFNLNLETDLNKLDEICNKLSIESNADFIRIHNARIL